MIGPMRPRTVDALRLSVTDRCNMRCIYCMPEEGVPLLPRDQILSLEQMARFVAVATRRGIRRVRITGGEPLLKRNLARLVSELAAMPGLSDISMTTNGSLLGIHAMALKEAGLHRVNVSLDTLDPESFRRLTRGHDLGPALGGIEAALKAGLDPVKINVVLMRRINDDPAPFVDLARRLPVHVRFIERMSFSGLSAGEDFVPIREIAAKLAAIAPAAAAAGPVGSGPARYVALPGLLGTVGFIEEREGHACAECNRLRLSCDGLLRSCLFEPKGKGIDIRALLEDEDDGPLLAAIDEALARKPRHRMRGSAEEAMSRIGG